VIRTEELTTGDGSIGNRGGRYLLEQESTGHKPNGGKGREEEGGKGKRRVWRRRKGTYIHSGERKARSAVEKVGSSGRPGRGERGQGRTDMKVLSKLQKRLGQWLL